ncbi:EpsG family protein [Sporosarcina thermotolerans]|uniref:EpsG family protein n=1 Tax=Sporosarcina thermotolerans TaxID=633404 RepID=UPI0036D3CBC5
MNLVMIFLWALFITTTIKKNKDLIFIILISTQLILLSLLRDLNVGADTAVYVNRFHIIAQTAWERIFQLSDIVDFEIGFIILNKLIGIVWENESFFLAVTSSIIILSISKYIYKNSKIVWLSFVIFIAFGFWGMSLNTLRQFIAIALILPSIKYIKSRDLIKFVIHILIASFFHISALSFLIIYPLFKMKINKFYITLVICIGVAVNLFSTKIIYFLMGIFGYHLYVGRVGNGSGTGMLLMLSLIAIAALLYRRSAIRNGEDYDLYIHILIVSILLNILALDFNLAGRAMIYFTIHCIILIPNIIYTIKPKMDRSVGIYIVLLGAMFYYLIILTTDVGSVVPYQIMSR